MSLRFVITDVFAAGKYQGNQLATVLDGRGLPDEEMQHIAAEFGFSETTFIMGSSPVDGAFPVRVFTPKAEIGFAGHPTLGTAHVLRRHVLTTSPDQLVLGMKVGPIPVRVLDDPAAGPIYWMTQRQPTLECGLDPGEMARMLGLDERQIDTRWPIAQVTTGLPFTVVPLRTKADLASIRFDTQAYEQWVKSVWAKGVLAFSLEGHVPGQSCSVRVFVPHLGILEDPATGSGGGCLAAYLVHHRCLGSNAIDLVAGQGYEMGRPSEIHMRARVTDDVYSLEIGGRVVDIATGQMAA